jgi:hypothetical protein
MALKIELHWQQTANYCEEVELTDEQVAEMKATGYDPDSEFDVFSYLQDKDELIKHEPVSYDGSEMDYSSTHFIKD